MSKTKYHFNPETGKTGKCSATVKGCQFSKDGVVPKHYKNDAEARAAYEETMTNKNVESLTKNNTDPYTQKYLAEQQYSQETDNIKKFKILKDNRSTLNMNNDLHDEIQKDIVQEGYMETNGSFTLDIVKNDNGSNDVYVSDEDSIYIKDAANLNYDESKIFVKREFMRHNLFNGDRYAKNDDGDMYRPLDSINKEYSDKDIDNIMNKAKQNKVEPYVVNISGTIVLAENKNSASESVKNVKDRSKYGDLMTDHIVNKLMKNKSDEDKKNAKEFIDYVRNYKK